MIEILTSSRFFIFCQKRYYFEDYTYKAIEAHFNSKGHKLSYFECSILEKVHDKDPMVLAIREQYWICKYKGVNLNQC